MGSLFDFFVIAKFKMMYVCEDKEESRGERGREHECECVADAEKAIWIRGRQFTLSRARQQVFEALWATHE